MLSATRQFAKSWVAAVLIGLLVVSFAIFGVNDAFKGNFTNDVVKAGSRHVSGQDFRREFDNFRKGAEEQTKRPISIEEAAQAGLDVRLMDEIATRESFGEMLRKIGVHPSDQLMESELRKIPAFFNPVSGAFDKTLYQQRLGENGLNPARFETLLRDQIAESHTAAAMVNGLRVPRAYGALSAIYELEARDVGYFMIDPRSVTQPAQPTDAQLEAFMKENADRMTLPEFRVLTVVAFTPAQVSGDLPIDPAEVQKRFEFRKDTLSRPETRTLVQIPAKDAAAAQAIADRLAKGEDPAAVAKSTGVEAINYADRPQSAVADKRVGAGAFALKEGQISTIQGDLGMAVVKVVKITPGQAVTLDQVRPQIEAELRKDAAAEKVYALSQAYEDARADGANLIEAAKKAGVPTFTLGPVTQQGQGQQGQPVPGLTPKMLELAYSLPAGGESEVQDAGEGNYFAVRVERVIPKALPPLAEVKPQLSRFWMMRELVKRMQTRADELAARVRKGESLEAVAASAGAKVVHVANLDRQNAAQSTALSRDALGKAFSVKQGDVFTAEGTQFGLIVGKLEAVRPPSGPTLARITEDVRPQVTMALFRDLGAAARKAARTEVKAQVYPDKARAALGLPPIEKAKAAEPAAKTEKAK
ncbi:peptidyl-prolyl cis-trans isomerase [Phenylobacterium sp.]|uniref:peptidylprolyl isomerase n=1 Tax=Phenylobacterium sp. TaxID=1871053 RepID=UPI0028962CDE|nr:peptidyl-prolyl cis-trans isomerase [Phenylobacterium sp.]